MPECTLGQVPPQGFGAAVRVLRPEKVSLSQELKPETWAYDIQLKRKVVLGLRHVLTIASFGSEVLQQRQEHLQKIHCKIGNLRC